MTINLSFERRLSQCSRTFSLIVHNLYIYIYIYIYIYSLKESEDGQLLTIKKLKNLIKNKNVSVLDLHQLHLMKVTDEGLRPKRFYFLLNFLTF